MTPRIVIVKKNYHTVFKGAPSSTYEQLFGKNITPEKFPTVLDFFQRNIPQVVYKEDADDERERKKRNEQELHPIIKYFQDGFEFLVFDYDEDEHFGKDVSTLVKFLKPIFVCGVANMGTMLT